MTKKEMNELADMIVDKLLTTYIREQATWYTTSTMDELYNTFKSKPRKRRTKKQMTESDLLGELAKLMTKLDYHTEREEYEICAELKKQIDDVNDKLSKL
jgi:CRISPR/Cas system CSM-associated protein Csm2 small subunit